MLESQTAPISEFSQWHSTQLSQRSRPFNIRIKPRKVDIEDYDLRETIGQGGFGKVRKAIHKLTGETVAVKICTVEHYQHDQLEAIQKEIELQKNLLHENIAQIYEVVRKQNKIYIFMEYCRNGQLFDKINRHGPMQEREAAKIFQQILSALIYLKESGLSHRDIKPQNVMFDENWNVKLIDFGFSCCNSNGQFRKTICGTPSYTAPEIIKRTSYDAQLVDVWCLGVTLYAMLAAQLPFQSDSAEKRKTNIVMCKYSNQSFFSQRVQKLFASIFVESKYRARLNDLKNSEFSLTYETFKPNYIDFNNQNPIVQDSIIDVIDRKYHVDPKKVEESIKNCKFDKYHALYYLTLKNEKSLHKNIPCANLDGYKKQRRGSLIKLEPISKTPTLSKKDNIREIDLIGLKTSKINKDANILLRPKQTIDPNRARLRNDSPDSPRRLLDCLAAYKGY